eukprot:8299995-Lingulodinium_polyedra.AAC.1
MAGEQPWVQVKPSGWACSCGVKGNWLARKTCRACGKAKPSPGAQPAPGGKATGKANGGRSQEPSAADGRIAALNVKITAIEGVVGDDEKLQGILDYYRAQRAQLYRE